MSSSGEIVIVLIGLLLQALMNRMKGGGGGGGAAGGAGGSLTNAEGSTCRAVVISPQDIIRRVTTQSHAVGVRLGEFRDVMSNMLASNAHELALSETVNHMLLSDLVALQTEKVARVVSGCVCSFSHPLAENPEPCLSHSAAGRSTGRRT